MIVEPNSGDYSIDPDEDVAEQKHAAAVPFWLACHFPGQ